MISLRSLNLLNVIFYKPTQGHSWVTPPSMSYNPSEISQFIVQVRELVAICDHAPNPHIELLHPTNIIQ